MLASDVTQCNAICNALDPDLLCQIETFRQFESRLSEAALNRFAGDSSAYHTCNSRGSFDKSIYCDIILGVQFD